jgi:hypothetical protein
MPTPKKKQKKRIVRFLMEDSDLIKMIYDISLVSSVLTEKDFGSVWRLLNKVLSLLMKSLKRDERFFLIATIASQNSDHSKAIFSALSYKEKSDYLQVEPSLKAIIIKQEEAREHEKS